MNYQTENYHLLITVYKHVFNSFSKKRYGISLTPYLSFNHL